MFTNPLSEVKLNLSFIDDNNLSDLKFLEYSMERVTTILDAHTQQEPPRKMFGLLKGKKNHVPAGDIRGRELILQMCKVLSQELFKMRQHLEEIHRLRLFMRPQLPPNAPVAPRKAVSLQQIEELTPGIVEIEFEPGVSDEIQIVGVGEQLFDSNPPVDIWGPKAR